MTDWTPKPGEMWGVVISDKRPTSEYYVAISRDPNSWANIPIELLHPLPAPSPHAELERAVLDQMLVWAGSAQRYADQRKFTPEGHKLWELAHALLAARHPPDPVKELREAWDKACSTWSAPHLEQVEAAIAAIEKAAGR